MNTVVGEVVGFFFPQWGQTLAVDDTGLPHSRHFFMDINTDSFDE